MKSGTPGHIKTKKLKLRLNLPLWQVIGILESLWQFAADCADDGGVGRYSNEDIAAYMEWAGDPDELVDALVHCRWLDAHETLRLVVHDWDFHMPYYVEERIRKREQRLTSKKAGTRPNITGTVRGQSQESVGPSDPTKPNQTKPREEKPNQDGPADNSPDRFREFWNLYPLNADGKKPGIEDCRIAFATTPPHQQDQIIQAVPNYRQSSAVTNGRVMNPLRFITKDWPDWMEPPKTHPPPNGENKVLSREGCDEMNRRHAENNNRHRKPRT